MKSFPALLFVLALLTGCAAHAPSSADGALSEQSAIMESIDLYDPNSTLEAATQGAVRCFPLSDRPCEGLLPMADGILLVAPSTSTTAISKLAPESGRIAVSAELPFVLSPQDTSLHPMESGFSCFDPAGQETYVLSEDLEITGRIPAPPGLTGSPILSGDGTTLYYSTQSAIRSMELETGISRILKEAAYPTQIVSGLQQSDAIVQCTIFDGTAQSTLFLSADTGTTLHISETLQQLQTSSAHYYAGIQEGSSLIWVFGRINDPVQTLLIPTINTFPYILPEIHAAIGLRQSPTGKVSLDYYELETGRRTASVSLNTETLPHSFVSSNDGSIWFLNHDETYGCDTLYRWNPELSAVTDDTQYTDAYFTREAPDSEGIDRCIRYAQEMSQRYGIEVRVYQDADDVQPRDFRLTYEHLVPVLMQELEQLDKSLGNYPDGFLQTISQRFDGLTVCILRSFSPISDNVPQDASNALQFWDGYHAYIALAAGTDTQKALYHELCHLIDTIVINECSAYDTWNQLNPTGFEYDYDYTANRQRNSTAYLLDSSRYFVDMYSMSFPKEDRARIMECSMTPGNAYLFQTNAMQDKLKTLCTGIREAFAMEDCTEVFLWEQYLHRPLASAA